MNDRMPWDITAAGADGEKEDSTCRRPGPAGHLIAVMLLTAAALDLTRCGLVLAVSRHRYRPPGSPPQGWPPPC